MLPRIIFPELLNRMTVFIVGLACILATVGCGGGGGGTPLPKEENVTISGKVDDGTANSPIPGATCLFIDQNGAGYIASSNTNGEYNIVVPPDVEGYIRCSPQGIPNLALSNFMSTRDREAGDRISGEDVTPARTVVADIIDSENPPVPQARKFELLDDINTGRDPDLTMVVDLSTQLYKSMLKKNVNVDFGGGEGGGGGDGGGVGGGAGDGGDRSPIANARCDFVVGNDLKTGTSLYSAALADFLDDGMINRPDLDVVKDEINVLFQGREEDVKAAFTKFFPAGLGKAFVDLTDADGNYFIESPPNVPGFVRCLPPNQEKLVLATYVAGRAKGDNLTNQDVNPSTTVFSTNIATKLTGDLGMTKQNYLDDIAGLEVFIREKVRDNVNISFFSLCEPLPGAEQPPDDCSPNLADTADNDVVMVAFSATTLFNSYYKNGVNGDYLAALENITATGRVDPSDLTASGMPSAQAAELSENVATDAAAALGTDLGQALSRARIGVTVTDGGLIAGADVDIPNPLSGISCSNCPATTDTAGQATLDLRDVPSTATEITVAVSGVPGYETATATTQVVAFATVDLEITLGTTPNQSLTVTKTGTGSGVVTSIPIGINCGTDCSQEYAAGTSVRLTADPAAGSTFAGWSGGGCSGTGNCTVTMDQARTVQANFTPTQYTLNVTKTGTGSGVVTSSPIGINCGTDCSQDYTAGTSVRLNADPTGGSSFIGWSGGGCSGTNSCTVTMDQARTVLANFSLPPIRPTISNISQQLVSSNYTCFNADGSTFTGYYYRISVNYQDLNGDVTKADGAKVRLDGSDFQWFSISGNGFTGTASADPCYLSAQHNRLFSMSVVDGAGLESDSLTVTIP